MNQKIVYMITCVVNGMVYVGKTVNPGSRWSTHKSHLRAGKHHCTEMQTDWDNFGSRAFRFRCVDIEEQDEDMEAVLIGTVMGRCYNKNHKKLAREEMLDEHDLPEEYHY